MSACVWIKELDRKEKALAEAAALLLLRKKLDALWEKTRANDLAFRAAEDGAMDQRSDRIGSQET